MIPSNFDYGVEVLLANVACLGHKKVISGLLLLDGAGSNPHLSDRVWGENNWASGAGKGRN